ncbi:Mn2+-dependent serine/threonine protein kinase [Encephalitozoon hellem ATCC 50504]|uniref:non-specific serine/threonine protein kinase n=1 Tax=Encephalitozoon hellem TaxID=27973 RepID=A0A9Q9F886_ENCHE|nr:Mn2+-dependent serine/threonine protein kinase [Encephalitozoon hellem ATCC 50504]AFM98407.1 Mn2+-dependent serine/threonine protein kinase [Encephalitozoon hellem ATCC 50504]UTX43329.1 Kae1-associated kinase Bud32 [Encephalitozoon hellem]WEL38791.1 Kae1-associated kinase Bud32 [Encephalitozoon hellem]|eukprot:XP_003887388.1 Mn2+-dependent serine/threonine protein kinase [Encephalitozoon hellem ATCC 50504]
MGFLFQGAESIIWDSGETVSKKRIRKTYRIEALDTKIISSRTKREAKILKKLEAAGIPAPRLRDVYGDTIVMEKIDGTPLKEKIDDCSDQKTLFYDLGVLVSRLHLVDVIHGDLTTSNFIFKDKIHVIDFGLSYISRKDEDKAVDLYVFEKAVGCRHDTKLLESFYKGYMAKGSTDVLSKLEAVRLRGRKRELMAFG